MLLAEADARMQASTGTRWVGVTSHPANDPDGWQLTTTTVLDVVPTQTLPNTWADHPSMKKMDLLSPVSALERLA